jgi:hypothetical protein
MTGLSHLGTDWLDQWRRVLRWHARLARIRTALPEADPEKAVALDEVFAFFMNCYHLADWVETSGTKTPQEVEAFIGQSEPMQLCRDVCNGLKHSRLYGTATNPNWSTTASYFYEYERTESGLQQVREGAHWVFVTDHGERDMFHLADQCVAAWRRFLPLR